MTRLVLAVAASAALTAASTAQKSNVEPKRELLNTVFDVKYAWDDDKKAVTITATGQVTTGGWMNAKLALRPTKTPPKDGIYEFELTAVAPEGFATQALSKITAIEKWQNPPADMKGVRVL